MLSTWPRLTKNIKERVRALNSGDKVRVSRVRMSWIQIWQWRNLKSGCGCFLVKSFQILSALWSLFDYEGWHHADRWSHKALTPANSGCFVSDLRAKDQLTGSMRFILKVPDLVHHFGIWLSCWFYEVSRSAVQYLNDLVTGSHHIKGNLQVIQKFVAS